MKRGKKLGILFIVLVVACAAAFAATKLSAEEEAEEDQAVSILTLDTDAVTALSWTYEGETLSFENTDGVWAYTEDEAFPLSTAYIDSMLEAISDITASKTIESPEELSQYGLEDPTLTVDVTEDGTTQLVVGDETSMGGERYLSIGDGNVYLVDSGIVDSFAYGLYDLVKKESIPSMDDISDVTVTAETRTLRIEHMQDSGIAYSDYYEWFLEDEDGAYLTLGTSETNSFVSQITDLSWIECVSYNASEEDLTGYGLDTPAVTVTVNYTETVTADTAETDEDGNVITEEREAPASFTLEIGGYADDGCYARIAGSRMVYLISSSVCDSLLYTGYEDLRPGDILELDWDAVTAVDIVLEGDMACRVEKDVTDVTDDDGETTEETVWLYEGGEVSADNVWTVLDALTATGSGSGLAPERSEMVSFIFYQDRENWPEVELSFYEYDSSSCLVSLNGETRLFAARDDVLAVVEAVRTEILLGDGEDADTSDISED